MKDSLGWLVHVRVYKWKCTRKKRKESIMKNYQQLSPAETHEQETEYSDQHLFLNNSLLRPSGSWSCLCGEYSISISSPPLQIHFRLALFLFITTLLPTASPPDLYCITSCQLGRKFLIELQVKQKLMGWQMKDEGTPNAPTHPHSLHGCLDRAVYVNFVSTINLKIYGGFSLLNGVLIQCQIVELIWVSPRKNKKVAKSKIITWFVISKSYEYRHYFGGM